MNRLNDKELYETLAKEMHIPKNFTDANLKVGFKTNLDSHILNLANFMLSMIAIHLTFGIETRNNIKNLKEWGTVSARRINLYKFNNLIILSAGFYKRNEEDHRSDKIELFFNLNINQNLTESDINKIDVNSQLEHRNQIQETKDSGWIFDKTNLMRIGFYKTVI